MDVNQQLSQNLKRLRVERKVSLDELAALSGVSKSMLSQIERGAANPSIAILWKIANGLKVSFSALVSENTREAEVLRWSDAPPLPCDDAGFRNYVVCPFEGARRFELHAVEIVGGSGLTVPPHPPLTETMLTVFTGSVSITFGETKYRLAAGDFIRFRADVPHSYRSETFETARLSMVIYYPD